MEAATTPKVEPLDEKRAIAIWQDCRQVAPVASLKQQKAELHEDARKAGVEPGETYLMVSIACELSGGDLKRIQAVASNAGREVELGYAGLVVY